MRERRGQHTMVVVGGRGGTHYAPLLRDFRQQLILEGVVVRDTRVLLVLLQCPVSIHPLTPKHNHALDFQVTSFFAAFAFFFFPSLSLLCSLRRSCVLVRLLVSAHV